MSGGGDRFGALPDELLTHVLSYLPSREAVQASLLSRRWRHLWRSTPAVHVRGKGDDFRLFVNSLIVHRGATPLLSFEIDADLLITPEPPYNDPQFEDWRGEVDRHVDLWVTHAVSSCRARSLTARFEDAWVPWLPRSPLVLCPHLTTLHLTTLHLDAVHLLDGLLDFSCCPVLQNLILVLCRLEGDALVSPSLERLAIVHCHSDETYFHYDPDEPEDRLYIGITTPRLRFMEISKYYEKEQFLEMMPWLTEDSIRYTSIKNIYPQRQW